MPPIYIPVALQGYNSLRASFIHLGTSMEQEKFFKSVMFV